MYKHKCAHCKGEHGDHIMAHGFNVTCQVKSNFIYIAQNYTPHRLSGLCRTVVYTGSQMNTPLFHHVHGGHYKRGMPALEPVENISSC